MRRWNKPEEKIKNPKNMSIIGRLYQARMWREFAMTFDGKKTPYGQDVNWVMFVLRRTKEECLRRARINVRLARRLNRISSSKLV